MFEDRPYPPPPRPDGSVDFAGLTPQHRGDYLDGWGHATVGLPAARPRLVSEFFDIGASEAREHAAKAAA